MSKPLQDVVSILRSRGPLTDDELEKLADVDGYDQYRLKCLVKVIEGIGCLVLNDASNSDTPRSGNFQGADTSDLLFTVAGVLEDMADRRHVASDAACQLQERWKERLQAVEQAR